MPSYSREDLLSLLDYLEKHRGNFDNFDKKSYRPLIKLIMFNSVSSSDHILRTMLEIDKESYVFLTEVSYEELPLYIGSKRLAPLFRWRLERGK
jgi:hypothetical protein